MKRKVKVNESQLKNIISGAIMEALRFERTVDKENSKGNVGPKDSNLNFFVTIGSGSNRKIVGDKGFKTREAAERKAKSLRDQGKTGVSIISKKVVEEGYGGISLADYDNPQIMRNRLDGDEMTQLYQYDSFRDEMDRDDPPAAEDYNDVLNALLLLRNKGLISQEEFDNMRDEAGV